MECYMKIKDCILIGMLIGVIFTIAICQAGYEDDMYKTRMKEYKK